LARPHIHVGSDYAEHHIAPTWNNDEQKFQWNASSVTYGFAEWYSGTTQHIWNCIQNLHKAIERDNGLYHRVLGAGGLGLPGGDFVAQYLRGAVDFSPPRSGYRGVLSFVTRALARVVQHVDSCSEPDTAHRRYHLFEHCERATCHCNIPLHLTDWARQHTFEDALPPHCHDEINRSGFVPPPLALPELAVRVNTDTVYKAVYGLKALVNSQHARAEVENSRASLAGHFTQMVLTMKWFVAMVLGMPIREISRLPVHFVIAAPLVDFFPDPRIMSVYPEAVIRSGQATQAGVRGAVCTVTAPAGELEAQDFVVGRRPVLIVDENGRWKVKYDETLDHLHRTRGEIFTHRGVFFSRQADGTNLPLFRAQSVPTGLHILCMSHARIVEGKGPVLTSTYKIDARRERSWYNITFNAADGEWQQSVLALQVCQSVLGKVLPWCGAEFQYALSHLTTVIDYPDICSLAGEFLDTSKLPEVSTPVPIPAVILQKIMPTLLGTSFEEDIAQSVQAQTVMQKAASEAKELGIPDRHIAAVCAGVYGIGVLEAETAKAQLSEGLKAAFAKNKILQTKK
jgi:hypothetical protein